MNAIFNIQTGARQMRFTNEVIGPARAKALLGKNIKNRPLNRATVDRYAADMKREQWVQTGDTIKIGKSGSLLDGQHRLQAVIKADVEVAMCVAYDVPDESFDSIDVGRIRKPGDVLALMGHKNYTTLAAAARLVFLDERGLLDMSSYSMQPGGRFAVVTNHDIANTVEACPDITQCVQDVVSVYRMAGKLLSYGLAAFVLFKLRRLSAHDADQFFSALTDGVGLNSSDPVFLLRERLIRNQAERRKLERRELYSFAIKAWNAQRSRKPFSSTSLRLRAVGPASETSAPPQPL